MKEIHKDTRTQNLIKQLLYGNICTQGLYKGGILHHSFTDEVAKAQLI